MDFGVQVGLETETETGIETECRRRAAGRRSTRPEVCSPRGALCSPPDPFPKNGFIHAALGTARAVG